jgi:hypothetical protein
MYRPNKWIDDDDAPTQKFRTTSVAPVRPTPSQRDGLWDANDVAGYLKVSHSWVYHRAEAGELPHLRIGGLLRWRRWRLCAGCRPRWSRPPVGLKVPENADFRFFQSRVLRGRHVALSHRRLHLPPSLRSPT